MTDQELKAMYARIRMFKRESNMNERVLQRERDEALAKILRLIARLETVEVQRNIAVNANKRANAALREANAKIIRLARAYE